MEGLLHPKQTQSINWGKGKGLRTLLAVEPLPAFGMLPGQPPAAPCFSLLLSLQPLCQGIALPLPK